MMALVGVLLAVAGSQVSAQATTLDLGDVTNNSGSPAAQSSGPSLPGVVDYDITFSLSTLSNVSVSLTNFNLVPAIFNITGFSATSTDFTLVGGAGGPFSFAGILVAGDYLIHVTGNATGTHGGLFDTLVTAAATPIPGALLLFMTAIGGMGFLGMRRRGSAEA
jgi:hypothetical protein